MARHTHNEPLVEPTRADYDAWARVNRWMREGARRIVVANPSHIRTTFNGVQVSRNGSEWFDTTWEELAGAGVVKRSADGRSWVRQL